MNVLGKRVYRLGQIELDASQGCIKINGREQYLRQKAFQLLLYLLEHRSTLVTKEELIENIWEGTAVTDDALVQLIKEVRRSLGDDPRQPQFIRPSQKSAIASSDRLKNYSRPALRRCRRKKSLPLSLSMRKRTTARRGGMETRRPGESLSFPMSPRRRVPASFCSLLWQRC
jgi:Transcriptional regulatory protein, C terminal